MNNKIIKKGVRIEEFNTIGIGGMTLDEAIKYFQELKKEHKDKVNLIISSVPRNWEEGYELALTHDRLETDNEYNYRIASQEKSLEYRKKQYKELKKEFGEN